MFITPLDVRWTGQQSFDLINYLVYENDNFTITVHPSFDYDGASIPRSLWSVIGCPMGELYSRAACLHDALYAARIFDRKMGDKLFHEAMLSDGVSLTLAKEMYWRFELLGVVRIKMANHQNI